VLLQTAGKAYKASLTQKYQTAQGLFDLFVPFGELTLKHTRPNGTAVLIVPNKLAAADYAHALRRHISTRRVLKVIDLGRVTPFRSVSAYPLIAVIQNQSPPDGVQVVIMTEESAGATATDTATDTAADTAGRYAQREAIPRDGGPWRLSLGDNTDKRQTAPGRRQALSSAAKPNHSVVPLAAVASLQAGITGFAAQRALTAVREEAALSRSDRRTAMPLIVTGGIDPYRIRFGETRFINRRFDRPMVVPNADAISAGKLKLFSKPKLVIGGMTRRVEAAYAPQPTAVGVQVFCITDWQVDPYFLLAVLNSDYASDWYYRQYRSKHLAGGYLSITKGHLKTLPIPLATTAEQQSVAELVKDLLRRIKDQGIDTNGRPTAPYEQEISRRVSQCFGNAGG